MALSAHNWRENRERAGLSLQCDLDLTQASLGLHFLSCRIYLNGSKCVRYRQVLCKITKAFTCEVYF